MEFKPDCTAVAPRASRPLVRESTLTVVGLAAAKISPPQLPVALAANCRE